VLLAVVGLGLGTVLVAWYGFDQIMTALVSVGPGGFVLLAAAQLILIALLGVAWFTLLPTGLDLSVWIFVWGRMVREATANNLPLSQVGGMVAGARATTLHGVSWPAAGASTVVDILAEFFAQILFTGIGLAIALSRFPHASFLATIGAIFAAALAAAVAVLKLSERAPDFLAGLVGRLPDSWFRNGRQPVVQWQDELAGMLGRRRQLAISTGVHVVGWIGKGFVGWIGFRLLAVPIDLAGALAIEALMFAVLSAAFLVPGLAGVQEATFIGIGALFGISPQLALSASLLRRARDLALGVPILLAWQWVELRRLKD